MLLKSRTLFTLSIPIVLFASQNAATQLDGDNTLAILDATHSAVCSGSDIPRISSNETIQTNYESWAIQYYSNDCGGEDIDSEPTETVHEKRSLYHFDHDLRSEAYTMALLSQIAYQNQGVLPVGYTNRQYIKEGNEEVLIVESPTDIVVAFSGTDNNMAEWLSFVTGFSWFDFEKRDGTQIGLACHPFRNPYHNNFRGSTTNDGAFFESLRNRVRNNNKKLIFTGHSKGGALATLAAMHIHMDEGLGSDFSRFRGTTGRQNFKVITFGEPRSLSRGFGNHHFDPWHRIRKHRFIYEHDRIPGLPPNIETPIFPDLQPFEHTGERVWQLKADGRVNIRGKCGNSDAPTHKNSDFPCRSDQTNSAADHSLVNYINQLRPNNRGGALVPSGQDQDLSHELVFDYTYYRNRYPDLRNVYGNIPQLYLDHWYAFGIAEGRQAHDNFSVVKYLTNNPDVNNAYNGDRFMAIKHFVVHGYNEGRSGI